MKWLPENFFKNSLSLYGVNAANIILPWVYFPYLVHVIGPDRFGEIALATAIVQYIIYIVDYGYNFTAPRSIALLRGQHDKMNEYVSALFINRLLLFCFSIFVLSVCIILGLIPENLVGLVLITAAGVLGYIFMPMFLFQGFEQMDRFSWILIGSKIVTAISIFIFIRVPYDYILYACILTGIQLVGGVLSIKLLMSSFEIHYASVTYTQIKEHLRNGISIVLSVGTINVFSASTTLILSMFASNSIVGSYAAGEKVIRAIQNLLAPIYRYFAATCGEIICRIKEANIFIYYACYRCCITRHDRLWSSTLFWRRHYNTNSIFYKLCSNTSDNSYSQCCSDHRWGKFHIDERLFARIWL